ncbi:EGF domain-specific O-linked N-acetylglucosamine transferase-like [Limulus polyphemus]|uniref:EGF domain-specific O-linked N-acetylglucosamine transferase-like n=1 Tax=Limulus polyphemus TaxID=6850 RepID=A0ABM1SIS8_LIMPO|nr:EGF domain-specific O-linked N-acetylglucosamine transferase-like [Limulus polyphemus]
MSSVHPKLCQFLLLTCWYITISSVERITEDQDPHCEDSDKDDPSCIIEDVSHFPGHWPSSYCKVKNVAFHVGEKSLKVKKSTILHLDQCFGIKDIWTFDLFKNKFMNKLDCDQVFERGYFVTMYYYHGSNYFHLHYDTVLPLYVALHCDSNNKELADEDIVILPAIELTRGQNIDWETKAFMDPKMYWMDVLQLVTSPHKILPVDLRLRAVNKTICFKEAFFGTPQVKFSDPTIIRGYRDFIKKRLSIKELDSGWIQPHVGIIHREGRRKILNEKELMRSVDKFSDVELIDFSKMSFQEQVNKVQDYDILVGINGAGLTNALYLPNHSVAIQLIPYKTFGLHYQELVGLITMYVGYFVLRILHEKGE